MERTTKAQIGAQLKMLNEALGLPVYTVGKDNKGKFIWNVGNIHMESCGNGGYRLVQVTHSNFLTRNLGHEYRMSKNEVWMALRLMIEVADIQAITYTQYVKAAKGE